MTEKLKQIAKEQIEKLPKEFQEAINSCDWPKITEELSEKFSLDEVQANDFQVETLLALVGLTDLNFYATYIENKVGTIKEVAQGLAKEGLEKIFSPIGDKIESIIKSKETEKNHKWNQNLYFILSGGDYSTFVERRDPRTISDTIPPAKIERSKIADIKSKFTI